MRRKALRGTSMEERKGGGGTDRNEVGEESEKGRVEET